MSDEPKLISQRAVDQTARGLFRPACLGLPRVRRGVDRALAKRRRDAPEDYARVQVARLTKALRCADVSLEEGV